MTSTSREPFSFSSINFCAECLVFVLMASLFKAKGLKLERVGVEYIRKQKLFLPLLSIMLCITIVTFGFFLKHLGMDPYFQWEEFGSSNEKVY